MTREQLAAILAEPAGFAAWADEWDHHHADPINPELED